MHDHLLIRHLQAIKHFSRQPCCPNSQVENLSYCRTDRAFIFLMITVHHVIGTNTPLLVGRSSQKRQSRATAQRVRELDSISHGINIRMGSLQKLVYLNSPRLPDL